MPSPPTTMAMRGASFWLGRQRRAAAHRRRRARAPSGAILRDRAVARSSSSSCGSTRRLQSRACASPVRRHAPLPARLPVEPSMMVTVLRAGRRRRFGGCSRSSRAAPVGRRSCGVRLAVGAPRLLVGAWPASAGRDHRDRLAAERIVDEQRPQPADQRRTGRAAPATSLRQRRRQPGSALFFLVWPSGAFRSSVRHGPVLANHRRKSYAPDR